MALRLKAKARRTDYESPLDCTALEPGDKVAVIRHRSFGAGEATMFTVLRRTATQIICEDAAWNQEERFRDDGSKVGDTRRPVLRAPFDPVVLDVLESLRSEQYLNDLHRAWTLANRKGMGTTLERETFLAKMAGLTAQAQTDLVSIRSAIVEWDALTAEVPGV